VEHARAEGISLFHAARQITETEELKPVARKALRALTDDFARWRFRRRWLRLIGRKNWLGANSELPFSLGEVVELFRIFVASIRTAEKNRQRPIPGPAPTMHKPAG